MKNLTPILLILILLISTTAKASNFYFSATGSDANTGTKNAPYKSISKLNSIFSTLHPGDSILFKRGEMFSGSITVNASGTSVAPIIIGAYGTGAMPVITSLTALTWAYIGGNVYRSNEAVSVPYMNLLTISNNPVQMGRWPNVSNADGGYNTMQQATSSVITDVAGLKTSPPPNRPSYLIGASIVMRTKRFWILRQIITDYSASTAKITFSKSTPGDDNPDAGKGYFIENSVQTLDENSEWYYSPSTQKIYMYSSSGAPANVSVASSDNLVLSSNKNYITFDNIDFNGCNLDALKFTGGTHITVQNCTIENAGRNGVRSGATYARIYNNTIINSLSKGVNLVNTSTGSYVGYNLIRDIGQLLGHEGGSYEDGGANHSGVGVYVTGSADNVTIEYNRIINCGHNGIHYKRQNGILIQNNFIDSVDNVMDDGGGIYCFSGTPTVSSNRQIKNNIILHGIGAPHGTGNANLNAGEGVAGIYCDKQASQNLITGNTIAYYYQGIFCNYGNNNETISNNLIYNTTVGLQVNTRSADKTRYLHITKNICLITTPQGHAIRIFNDAGGDNIASFGLIDSNYYYTPLISNTLLRYSTGYSSSAIHDVTLAAWRSTFSFDTHSTTSPYHYASNAALDTSLSFHFNSSAGPSSMALTGKFVSVQGDSSNTGSVSIPSYKSWIGFRTGSLGIVIPPDFYPTAAGDNAVTNQNIMVSASVAANDIPSADGGNTWALLSTNGGAINGTVVMDAGGSYTYTPSTGFVGVDAFNYSLCDLDGDCVTASVTITILPAETQRIKSNYKLKSL